ncbi:MAG: aminotransferase class I/II-fold pyridoxal phosphate-dependent enzyme, partial [Anaerolineae bacterium]
AASLQALEDGQTHYVDVPGIGELRAALAEAMTGLGLAGYSADHMLVTAGIQESRFLTIQKIGESFGRIGLPAVVHPGAHKAAGTRALTIDTLAVNQDDYLPSLDAMRAALEDGCRLLFLESPSRLSGAAYSAGDVAAIAALLEEFDAGAIWDQGLAPWVEGYVSLGARPGMVDRVAVIGEAWPGQGLESWAIAYIGAKADWFEPMRSQKQIMAICTSTASQYAALKAAERYAAHHEEQVAALAGIRQDAAARAEAAGLEPVPGDAVSILALRNATGEIWGKLEGADYRVAAGQDFGAPGVMRLATGSHEALSQALSTL